MELERLGHEVYQFGMEVEEGLSTERALVFREDRGLQLGRAHYLFFYPRLFAELRDYLLKVHPEVIHLHNISKYPATILLAVTKDKRAPVIESIHDYAIICPRTWNVTLKGEACADGPGIRCWQCLSIKFVPRFFLGIYRIRLSRRIDAFIAASQDMKGRLESSGYKNVYWIPYFFDLSTSQPRLNRKEDNRIFHVSQLAKHKGTRYLIEAMGVIVSKLPQAKLHIIGGGPEEGNLRELARSLGLERNIIFHGFIWDDKRLKEEYERASVVVIPSIWMENTPLVAYQAMASGTPLVGDNMGGITELIENGETGFLVNPREPGQIADKVVQILSDKELARKMGERAMLRIKEFSQERHIQSILSAYEETVRRFTP